jgi:hypothetical protein
VDAQGFVDHGLIAAAAGALEHDDGLPPEGRGLVGAHGHDFRRQTLGLHRELADAFQPDRNLALALGPDLGLRQVGRDEQLFVAVQRHRGAVDDFQFPGRPVSLPNKYRCLKHALLPDACCLDYTSQEQVAAFGTEDNANVYGIRMVTDTIVNAYQAEFDT